MEHDNTKEITWKKRKRIYKYGVAVFFLIFIISFAKNLKKNLNNLPKLENVVLNSCQYKSLHGRTSKYFIQLKIKGNENRFKINSSLYQTLKHEEFKKEIAAGDTVTIIYRKSFSEYEVYSLVKNGKEYCALEKAREYENKNKIWQRILSGYAFIICLIPLFHENRPFVHYGTILIIGLILLSIILADAVGCQFVISKDFK